MEPLDLTKTCPRPPRERALNLMFLPRTIDKFRARLPGGNVADFMTDEPGTTSHQILVALGIAVHDFERVIRDAKNEAEVLEWLDVHMNHKMVPAINDRLERTFISKLPQEVQAAISRSHPNLSGRTDLDNHLDFLEADDAATFKTSASS